MPQKGPIFLGKNSEVWKEILFAVDFAIVLKKWVKDGCQNLIDATTD